MKREPLRVANRPAAARRRRRAAASLLVLVLSPVLLAAGDDPPPQRAVLDLVVNQAKAGQVLAVIRPADVLVPPDALRRAGIVGLPAGREEVVGTRSFVSLGSLAPALEYSLDEKALVLRVTARPESFGTHRIDMRDRQRPAFSFTRNSSAFLNYGLDWHRSSARSATAEVGINLKGVLLTSTGTWQGGRGFVPGLTSVVVDDRSRVRRMVIGESFAGDRLLGGSVLLAGFKVSRDYSVDPYFVRYPLLGMSGMAETPSSVEVYVDGRLVRQERVPAGRFDLANVPVPVGSSRTQVVIRDAFGREQEMRAPYYMANGVLAAGLHEYEYAVGLPRITTPSLSVAYQAPVVLARHRYGFSDVVTGGMRFEARSDLVSGGPSANLRAAFGEIELAGAVSGGMAGTGGALAIGYAWVGSPLNVGLSARAATDRYRTLSTTPTGETRYQLTAYGGVRLGGRGTLMVQHMEGETVAGASRARTSVFASARLNRRSQLTISAGRTRQNDETAHEAFLGLNFALGRRILASLSAGIVEGEARTSLELARSLPLADGYGYRLRTGTAGDPFVSGRFEYQSPYGRYEVTQESRGGLDAASVSMAGGLVAIGGGFYATRPVREGFGLLRVPGVKGVRGFLSNQPVGRTNARGDLLIPNMLPYYANRVSIADQDVPIGREVQVREQAVAPPYRGGAVIRFDADRIAAATGTVKVTVDGQEVVPEYGDVAVKKEEVEQLSPVGRGGRFYFEHLPPGRYTATVRYHGGSCDFTIAVHPSSAPVVNVGAYSCRLEAK